MKKWWVWLLVLLLFIGICARIEIKITFNDAMPIVKEIVVDSENTIHRGVELVRDGIITVAEFFHKSYNNFIHPIVDISLNQLPKEARKYYKMYEEDKWNTYSKDLKGNFKTGQKFYNNDNKLPKKSTAGYSITYKKFDAEKVSYGNRGVVKHFVHGDDGSTYYTVDNCKTFKRVIK